MELVIAEKPSVALSISKVIGAKNKILNMRYLTAMRQLLSFYSTVTDLARFLGLSTSFPLSFDK